jgi:hypothetical protein
MGRKAKLKKQRHQEQINQTDVEQANPQDFIKQMSKEGYSLQQIKRSPEVPRKNIEPQI